MDIGRIIVLIEFITLIIAIIHRNKMKNEAYYNILLSLLWITFILEFSFGIIRFLRSDLNIHNTVLEIVNRHNRIVYSIYNILSYVMYMTILNTVTISRMIKKLNIFLVWIGGGFMVVNLFFLKEESVLMVNVLGSVLVMAQVLYLVFESFFEKGIDRYHNELMSYIMLGVFVFHICYTLLIIDLNAFSGKGRNMFKFILLGMNIFMYGMFCFGIIYSSRRK